MSILIVGSEGSMGKRYQAILKYLGKEFECIDKDHSESDIDRAASRANGIILATPTGTHAHYLELFGVLGKPILCEKPVMKDPDELKKVMNAMKQWGTPFRMMFQYSLMVDPNQLGPSLYNYFRHGSDGLVWDCMQIVALARTTCELREDSPIWSCKINGKCLNGAHMDAAYIAYVQRWFKSPSQDTGYLIALHEKVSEAEKKVSHGKYH